MSLTTLARRGRLDSTDSMTQNRIESVTDQPTVPPILLSWLAVFRPCFTAPVWNHILVLVGGAVLAPGKRTVTQALRVMGLADRPGFGRYHEALNRARWDARDVARRLLLHLLAVLSPSGEVVIGESRHRLVPHRQLERTIAASARRHLEHDRLGAICIADRPHTQAP